MRIVVLGLVMAALGMLCGCAAPTRTGDASLSSERVPADFFAAPEVRLHRFSAPGARISDPALHAALKTIESHLGRPIRVVDHGESAQWGANGPLAPIQDRGRPIGASDLADGVYRLSSPQEGILGIVSESPPGDGRPLVLVEPATIILVELPGPKDGIGVTGIASVVALDGPDLTQRRKGLVVLERSVIRRRSNWFVSEAKLSQWTLTHEIGHVLGVPASNTHIWAVPGLGPHCTDPRCVMYTGFDWRVLWTGIVRGWPMDFCAACSKELAAARSASAAPPAGND